jgi:citrate synthase
LSSEIDQLIATALKIPVTSVVDSLEYLGVPEWDSLGHLSIVLALEARFGVSISDERVPELTTVKGIRAFAARHAAA